VFSNKLRAEAQGAAQPVQQAQALIERRAFDAVTAFTVGHDGKPVVELDLALRLLDILQGYGIIHAINGADVFHGDTLSRHGKQQ